MSLREAPVGVVLFNLGGPDNLDAVEPFLVSLFSDREIIELPFGTALQPLVARLLAKVRGPSVRRNYSLIGGGSPQVRITRAQAAALENRLNRDGSARPFRVLIAMRYSRPSSADVLAALEAKGIRRVVTLPLYPHWSKATTGSSRGEFARTMAEACWSGLPFEVSHIDGYADDPLYLDALADTVRRAYEGFELSDRQRAVLLFSAHGLPKKFIDEGDPYVDQIDRTRQGLLARLGLPNRHILGYQSRTGPVRWIGPGTDELIAQLGAEGVKALLIIPLSFVSDHIETLYEVDILFRELAARVGIAAFRRPEALNRHPQFIEALAGLVERHLGAPQASARPVATAVTP